MSFDQLDIDHYLQRIKLDKRPNVTLDGLRQIYLAHLHTFVFENIDCLLDLDIKLEVEDLFDKLILKKRGGYCFELNLFFYYALKYFGFDAHLYLGRVFYRGNGINAKTHLTVLVKLDQVDYIVDAGFGGPGPEDVLPLVLDQEMQIGNYQFIISDSEFGKMIKRKTDGEFKNVYAFFKDTIYPNDIEMSNFYVSRLPASAFRNNFNICKFNKLGRRTLFNNTYNIIESGSFTSTKLSHFSDFLNILETEFKIELDMNQKNKLQAKWIELEISRK